MNVHDELIQLNKLSDEEVIKLCKKLQHDLKMAKARNLKYERLSKQAEKYAWYLLKSKSDVVIK